jgi:hypothetical protein
LLPVTPVEGRLPLRIEVWVERDQWREVRSLGGASPSDDVFVVDREAGRIEFGDGIHGRRPPIGSEVVAATYQHGAGGSGHEGNRAPPIDASDSAASHGPTFAIWTVVRADAGSVPFPGADDSVGHCRRDTIPTWGRIPAAFAAGGALGLLIGLSWRQGIRHRG